MRREPIAGDFLQPISRTGKAGNLPLPVRSAKITVYGPPRRRPIDCRNFLYDQDHSLRLAGYDPACHFPPTNEQARSMMKTTRRLFLGKSALGLAALSIVPRHVLGGPRFVPPSEKVNVALVGRGRPGADQSAGPV